MDGAIPPRVVELVRLEAGLVDLVGLLLVLVRVVVYFLLLIVVQLKLFLNGWLGLTKYLRAGAHCVPVQVLVRLLLFLCSDSLIGSFRPSLALSINFLGLEQLHASQTDLLAESAANARPLHILLLV